MDQEHFLTSKALVDSENFLKEKQAHGKDLLGGTATNSILSLKKFSDFVYVRFYAELNEFLPPDSRGRPLSYPLNGPVAVKHVIEASGVPHTEVALILAESEPVDFAYLVQANDRISVYPAFRQITLEGLPELRPPLERPARFILDNHLGRLAAYLRLLGFDTLYRNDYDDEELAQVAHDERRVLLTRDRRLLMRKQVHHGYCLATKNSREQLRAVLHRFQLADDIQPWRRCLRCNGRLAPVEKAAILDRLEPKTKLYYESFQQCQDCDQIYWQGSHYERLSAFVQEVLEANQGVQRPEEGSSSQRST